MWSLCKWVRRAVLQPSMYESCSQPALTRSPWTTVVTPPGRLRRNNGLGKHHARLQPADLLGQEAEPDEIGVGEERVKTGAMKVSFRRNPVSRKDPAKIAVPKTSFSWDTFTTGRPS